MIKSIAVFFIGVIALAYADSNNLSTTDKVNAYRNTVFNHGKMENDGYFLFIRPTGEVSERTVSAVLQDTKHYYNVVLVPHEGLAEEKIYGVLKKVALPERTEYYKQILFNDRDFYAGVDRTFIGDRTFFKNISAKSVNVFPAIYSVRGEQVEVGSLLNIEKMSIPDANMLSYLSQSGALVTFDQNSSNSETSMIVIGDYEAILSDFNTSVVNAISKRERVSFAFCGINDIRVEEKLNSLYSENNASAFFSTEGKRRQTLVSSSLKAANSICRQLDLARSYKVVEIAL